MKKNDSKTSAWNQLFLSAFILTSCNLNPLPDGIPPPASPPETGTQPAPSPTGPAKSCVNPDPDFQCIGLKIVSYETPDAATVLPKARAEALVDELNSVWSPCKIGFQLETWMSVNPLALGLQYNPNWRAEASTVRSTFDDSKTMLIVATGKLTSSTIAVTQMPGYAPFGTLVEDSFAGNPLTVGHELGHYMGLYHLRNTSNLMNPWIGDHTRELSASQCSIARSTNQKYWVHMMR
jgi:hypothetical protein